jgi:phosphoribosylanthranilate isomerase
VPVGVFADQPALFVATVAKTVGLSWIQLHGKESPEVCAALSGRFSVIKAIAVDDKFDGSILERYRAHVAAFLFDSKTPGAGKTFDWAKLKGAPFAKPWFVAGGLTSENVADAIRTFHPNGVDTASGVETAGAQDPAKIQAFVKAAKGTL